MYQIKVEKHRPRNTLLKNFIKYFWVLRTDNMRQFSYKLLPVNNIDVVLNFAAPMNYHKGSERNTVPEYSFSGIRNHYQLIDQVGKCNIFGISFFPAGFYPFLKMPLSEHTDQTIDFSLCEKKFRSKIEGRFNLEGMILQQIEAIFKQADMQIGDISRIIYYTSDENKHV